MFNCRATSSQELLDGSSPTFQELIELCQGLINFAFIWQPLKGCCHGNQRRKIGVSQKNFFIALPFWKGLEYQNGDGQLRSALNMAKSCTNTVRERSLFMQNSRTLNEMRQLHQYDGMYTNNKNNDYKTFWVCKSGLMKAQRACSKLRPLSARQQINNNTKCAWNANRTTN